MFKFRIFIVILTIIAFSVSCKQEKVDFTIVQTGEVFVLNDTNAILTAKILTRTDQIIEYGFKWSYSGGGQWLDPERSYSISKKETLEKDYFEFRLTSSMVKYDIYQVRAYVKTAKGISYGRYVSFMAMGSESTQIIKILPDTVSWNDTITITGKNFGYSTSDVKLTAGTFTFPILRMTNDTIITRVPSSFSLSSSTFKLVILTNTCLSSTKFNLAPPKIFSIKPDTVGYLTPVRINGKYFNSLGTSVSVNGTNYTISSVSPNTITFLFPPGIPLGYNNITVKVFGQTVTSPGKLFHSNPLIKSFVPLSGSPNDVITIKGKYFGAAGTKVKLGETLATIQSINDSIIKFVIPNNIPGGQVDLKVLVDNLTAVAQYKFELLTQSITSFAPAIASYGDTISITGDRFSDIPSGNIVKFGSFQAAVISASNQLLKVIVPPISGISSCNISLTVGNNTIITSGTAFSLIPPVIDDFFPKNGTFLDTITIYARYLHPVTSKILLRLGGIALIPAVRTPAYIKIVVPVNFYSTNGLSNIIINSDVFSCSSAINFELNRSVLDSISPFNSQIGDTVSLFGKFLNPDKSYSKIQIPEIMSVLSSSSTKVSFVINNTTHGLHTINYTTGGQTFTLPNGMFVKKP